MGWSWMLLSLISSWPQQQTWQSGLQASVFAGLGGCSGPTCSTKAYLGLPCLEELAMMLLALSLKDWQSTSLHGLQDLSLSYALTDSCALLLWHCATASAAASPSAVAATLEMLRQAVPWQVLEAAAEQEAQRQAAFFLGPDIKEGLAAVKEKRQPEF